MLRPEAPMGNSFPIKGPEIARSLGFMAGHTSSLRRFAQKVVVSDPLAALQARSMTARLFVDSRKDARSSTALADNCPPGKGDSREAAGGRSHALSKSTFGAKPSSQ